MTLHSHRYIAVGGELVDPGVNQHDVEAPTAGVEWLEEAPFPEDPGIVAYGEEDIETGSYGEYLTDLLTDEDWA